MDQIFAFKTKGVIFRFYLTEDQDLLLKIEGRVTIAPKFIYSFLLQKGVLPEYIDKKAVTIASKTASGSDEIKDIIVATSKRAKQKTTDVIIRPYKDRNPYVEQFEIIGGALHKEGVEGSDIFGNPIPVPEEPIFLKKLKNIQYNQENGQLMSLLNGKLIKKEDSILVMPEIDVSVSDDNLEAKVSVFTDRPISQQELAEAVERHNIIYGLDRNAFEKIINKTKEKLENGGHHFIESVLIATGKPMENAIDGFIDWHIEIRDDVTFVEDSQGNINFKNSNIVKNIKKGEILAILNPHIDGIPGVALDGAPITPNIPKSVKLKAGKGVVIRDGKTFAAEIDGEYSFKKDLLEVTPVFVVKENVDFSIGNINFDGSVRIGKDILSGFTVDVSKDINIDGVVESVKLRAGGKVEIKGGISGQENAIIIAGESIVAKYISESIVIAEGDIIVESSIIDSKINTNGTIVAINSAIIGNSISAIRGIVCKDLGSSIGIETTVTLGIEPEKHQIYREFKELESHMIKENENTLFKKSKFRNRAERDKEFSPEKKLIRKNFDELQREILKATGGFNEINDPIHKLVVMKSIYPGVKIKARGVTKEFNKKIKGPVLVYFNELTGKIAIKNILQNEQVAMRKNLEAWLSKKEKDDVAVLWHSELAMVEKYLKKDTPVIDIGCCLGRASFALHTKGYKNITGVDFDENIISIALDMAIQKNIDINFSTDVITSLKFKDEMFDGAIFFLNGLMLIEKKSNRVRALKEISRVLKPDAHLIFTTFDNNHFKLHKEFWQLEQMKLKKGSSNPLIKELGDTVLKNEADRTEVYRHIPMENEIHETVYEAGFTIVEEVSRDKICREREEIESISPDCKFWVVQKQST